MLLYSPINAFAFQDLTTSKLITPTISGKTVSFTVNDADLTDGYYTLVTKNSLDSPLPVNLLNFDAYQQNNEVVINWKTASEVNNDYFTVKRSADGITWESLLTVMWAGNNLSVLNYSAVDRFPYAGMSYNVGLLPLILQPLP